MDGPLSQVMRYSHRFEMLVSVLVGIGFGLALERGGFGTAKNLVATFYGRDFRVVRVMFSAIVTAMVGLYALDLLGVLPLPSIGIMETFVGAQVVGGLLVGVGFIVGGYCPGTSIVAAVSGKLDALLFMGGILLGTAGYTLGADAMAPLASSGAKGRVLLHEWLHVSSGPMVLGVALFAIASFWLVGKIEARVAAARAVPAGEGGETVPAAVAAAERSAP
jgi:hypothetical protein